MENKPYLYPIKIPEGVDEMEIDSGEGEPAVVIPVQAGMTYPLTCTDEGIGLNTEKVSDTRIRVSKISLEELFAKKPKDLNA